MESKSSTGTSFEFGDIYYAFFRHKWKLLICTLIGLGAGYGYYKRTPPPYQSEAKLFVRFVISDQSIDPGEDDVVRKAPGGRGDTIISSEMEILKSRDLAETVARNIGPEKVLAKWGGRSLDDAATVIFAGLSVDVPPRSNTLRLVFQHPDPDMVQPILGELINSYLRRHGEIHRATGMVGEFLASETDQLRARLTQTEEELRKANNKAGVISLEAAKSSFSNQASKIREAIFEAQAELSARTSVYEEMVKSSAPGSAASPEQGAGVPQEKIDAYQKIATRVAQLRQNEQNLLTQFTEEVPRVKENHAQLVEAEARKKQLETEFPTLVQIVHPIVPTSSTTPQNTFDQAGEAARITALQARIKTLQLQMDQVRKDALALDEQEIGILELRRRRDLEESNYKHYSNAYETSRIKEAMGENKVSNISIVQKPTPPARDFRPVKKIAGIIAGCGLGLGLIWTFLIEFYFDRSVRRPADVERSLQLPLFLSIPKLKSAKKALALPSSQTKALANGAGGAFPGKSPSAAPNGDMALANYGSSELEIFHTTLRDRLISYFESINLRHKPKLVAVTGLGRGTGVTTTAAGLARMFSETGEGNVLLVDMTQGQGSAKHFHKGTQVELEQLFNTRNSAFVQSNLYVVTEHSGSERLSKGMPQRFNELVPKLKASDFDYIIFDMPPVSQISITPRLASFMDMVLMVVESEKTDRAMAERAAGLLAQSKTNVGVVLNKTKSYVPSVLHKDRDLLGM